jgi:glycosyltransferase involved in cell wall biosynthesis
LDSPTQEKVPLVSVVVALCADDRADLFRDALTSVFQQSMRDFECIIAADGPLTPELEAAIAGCAVKDARLRRVDIPVRSGPAAARNRAIAQARGMHTAILDADDAAKPERLERQLSMLESSGVDIAGTGCHTFGEEGSAVGRRRVPVGEAAIRRTMWRRNPLVHSTVMARTMLLRDHPYPENLRYGEDYRLWVNLARQGFRIDNHPDELVRYFVNHTPKPHGGRWGRFTSDTVTRLLALRLLPTPLALLYAPAAVLIAATRLLPNAVWRLLRKIA